jgi:3-hydroxyacyl-CoA dehydrogenase/enoyl-CoA hydratase/3-hydroxybutyryl-CoA epimerase
MTTHFVWEIDRDQIVWLGFGKSDASTNVLTEEVLEAFDEALVSIAQDHPKGLVIYSRKENGFIAGADVKAFAKISSEAAAHRHIQRVHEIFHRLESLAFPSVAMIHGFCLGGGLELALACTYRVARDDESTRLAFPEVRLGIFPGYGGTARSLRTIGDLPALKMMLSGRSISGRSAKRMGLVDQAAPQRQLRNVARQLLMQSPQPRRAGLLKRIPGFAPLRPLLAQVMKHQVRKSADPKHYPAPNALLRHWLLHAGNSRDLYKSEASEVASLICADSAQQLIRVFLLQDRLKALGDRSVFVPRHVHVVGGGIMGGDIAAWCALSGMRVTLQDRAPQMLGNAVARAHKLFRQKLKDRYRIQRALDRLMPDHEGAGISQADVVIEAIFEDLDTKQALYAQIEPQMKTGAILATNTSSIPLSELGAALSQPKRLVGLHFFNPVAKMPLLEVVSEPDTEPAVVERALSFARHIDKLPLPVRSSPGFLVNRVLMPYLLEAVQMLDEGIEAPLIDLAAKRFGMPMGPIELADTVGLDVCLSVARKLSETLGNEVPGRLLEMVDAGQLGRKTGLGFYTWKQGKPRKPALREKQQLLLGELADRMILRLVNESVACLREGVVEDADLLDAGVIFGTGFAPFRGGPMNYVHTQGKEECESRLHRLESHYGAHFHADDGWGSIA